MAPLQRRFSVSILDEVQLITEPHRGFAWTRALLGVQTRQLHLCGALDPASSLGAKGNQPLKGPRKAGERL